MFLKRHSAHDFPQSHEKTYQRKNGDRRHDLIKRVSLVGFAGNRYLAGVASKPNKTRVERMNEGFFKSRMDGKPKMIANGKAPFFAITR